MPFCPHCGNELPALAGFCPRCGRPTTGIAEVAIEYGAPDLRPAGFWIRFGGFVIDGVVVAVLSAVLARLVDLPGALVTGPGFDPADPRIARAWRIDRAAFFGRQLAGLSVGLVYSWLLLAFNRGRTLGAMAVGVRVARADGEPVESGRALGRQLFAIVSRFPFYLGFLWAAWDRDGKTWHDHVAGTRVFLTR